MNSIILILPYFGKWPVWFDAFLVSVKANPTVHWLCPTDCELPDKYPDNIQFLPTDLQTLNNHVNRVVDAQVPLNPRKFCDLKPAYGAIFYEEIKYYDFWGFCDMDIIWGDIRKFMTEEVLSNYDIISSRKQAISGHFSLFRNTDTLRNLYKQVPNYQHLFEQPKFMWFDEHKLTHFLHSNNTGLRVYWDKILCNQERGRDSHQEYYLDRWLWKSGKMLNTKTQDEVMYLHFINWKRTFKNCEVKYADQPDSFYISYNKMHYQPHTVWQKLWNGFTNVFDGYYIKEKRRRIKLKSSSFFKKNYRKLRNSFKVKLKNWLELKYGKILKSNLFPVFFKFGIFKFIYKYSFININPNKIDLVLIDSERFKLFSQKKFFIKTNPDGIKKFDEEKAYIKSTVQDFLIKGLNYKNTIQYQMMIDRIKNNDRPLYGCKNEFEIESYFQKLSKSYLSIRNNGYLTQQELKSKFNNSRLGDEIEVYITDDNEIIASGGSGNHRICIAKELGLDKIPVKFRGVHFERDKIDIETLKKVYEFVKKTQ